MSDYSSQPFKSFIANNHKDIGISHFVKTSAVNAYNIYVQTYRDGLITVIDPKTSFLSISINYGKSWIPSLLKLAIKNVKRVGKETFIFEILNGASPTLFAVTYDLFSSYTVIPVGTDNDSIRMRCKNQIYNKPLGFIRNSLYSFDEKLKTYSKILTFTTEYCSLHDSIDGISTYLITPSTTGYSVRKFDKLDRSDVTYINHYSYTVGSWIGSLLSFNIAKTTLGIECFIVTTTDFRIQIDIPDSSIFSSAATRKNIQFKDSTITTTNCNSNNILISSINDRIYIFTNATYKRSCSIYFIDSDGNFIRENDVFFSNCSTIRDKDNNLFNNSLDDTILHSISIFNDKFIISSNYKSILFDIISFKSVDFIDINYSTKDISGSIIGNIYVSDDVVSFNNKFNNIIGSNVSFNPVLGFSKYQTGNFGSIVKDTEVVNTPLSLKGLPVGGSFYVKDNATIATFAYNADRSSTITHTSTINLPNTYIVGACFYDNDLLYIKIKSKEVLNNTNYHKHGQPILCSFNRGELISFPVIVSARDKFISSDRKSYEYARFKSIKVINNNLVVLFYNLNPFFIDKNCKKYKNITNSIGLISSIDYTGEYYVAGVTEPVQKVETENDLWAHGNSVYIGKSIKHLSLFDKCTVIDIKMDKYRDLLYISTLYDFSVYDKFMNLIVKYNVNSIHNTLYDKLNVSKRFLLYSNYNDIKRILSQNTEIYEASRIVSFTDSVNDGKDVVVSTNSIDTNLSTNNSLSLSVNSIDIVTKINNNKPLFTNSLIGKRDNNSFSIYSKDELTGIIAEFSFDNRLIVSYPTNNSRHDTKCIIIESGATVVSNTVTFVQISIKVIKNIIILRVGSLLKVYKLNTYNGSLTQEYFTTLSIYPYPELGSAIIYKNKLLIPYGNSTILELTYGETITFIRYAQCRLPTGEDAKIHQIENFNGILLCVYNIGSSISKIGIIVINDTIHTVLPLEYINTYSIETPLLKVYPDYIEVIYTNNLVSKFTKDNLYTDKYDVYTDEVYSSNSKKPISIDNSSIRNSLNRNFVLPDTQPVEKYEMLIDHPSTGLIKDFDSGKVYDIIKYCGGHFIISDTFTDRKRIDISVEMGSSNVVKRLKTDKFDINVDEALYPTISALIKDISTVELNMLCTLILSKTAL